MRGRFRRAVPVVHSMLLAAALSVPMAACGGGDGGMPSAPRVSLPDSVPAGATLSMDSLGRAWVGQPGLLTVYDPTGRQALRLPAGGQLVPRHLWMLDTLAYVRAGGTVSAIEPATERRTATRRASPLARDPRGRWLYTAGPRGGVLGLAPATLETRWGWPDPGAPATALAVSALGDRVYVALAESERNGTGAAVEVRDAQTGALLHAWKAPGRVDALEAGPDNTLYAVSRGSVLALRHGSDGLVVIWSAATEGDEPRLRVSPTGARVAVMGEGRGLLLLDAGSGDVLGRTDEAPRDADFDVAGRLWVLYPREIRIIP